MQALGSFNICAETLSSRSVTESDLDYVLNILERAAEETFSEVRQAPTLTEAKMLLHLQCSDNSIFDSVRPHRTFNYRGGIVFHYDLGELSKGGIYAMCPLTVQTVWKVKGKANMIFLTFFRSSHPDNINVGPLQLRVKTFIGRPLQLMFNCYEFGPQSKTLLFLALSRVRMYS